MFNCPNCGARLDEAFCARCGQKASPLNPSLRHVLENVLDEVLNLDGKIFRSVRLLLTRPGFLSREHFEGRRARYVSPIRLYLLFSVVYFAAAAFAPNTAVRVTVMTGPDDSPQEIQRLEQRRQELEAAATTAFVQWAPRVMFVLVPVFAGLVALAVRKSGRHYPQHLYFALHVHAAWFFAGAISALARMTGIPIVTTAVPLAAAIYAVVYVVAAFSRAYSLTVGAAVLRAAAVGTAYVLLVLAALLAIILRLGFSGGASG